MGDPISNAVFGFPVYTVNHGVIDLQSVKGYYKPLMGFLEVDGTFPSLRLRVVDDEFVSASVGTIDGSASDVLIVSEVCLRRLRKSSPFFFNISDAQ